MKKARQVCDAVGCRMFVHVANPDVPLPELIDYFYPGDNFTHTYNKGNILDQDGHVYKEAWEAKGVVSSSIRPAAPATGAPRWPRLPLPRLFPRRDHR